MAFVVTWEAAGLTQERYEATLQPMLLAQPAPAGLLVHVSGPMEDGWRGIDVWESQAAADAFGAAEERQALANDLQMTFTSWHAYDATV